MSNEKPIRHPDNMEVTISEAYGDSGDIILTITQAHNGDRHAIIMQPAEARKVVDTLSQWLAGVEAKADYEVVNGGRYVDEDGKVVKVVKCYINAFGARWVICLEGLEYYHQLSEEDFKKTFRPVE